MDPIENLRQIRLIAKGIISDYDNAQSTEDALIIMEKANDLASLFIHLDKWIQAGGFNPFTKEKK